MMRFMSLLFYTIMCMALLVSGCNLGVASGNIVAPESASNLRQQVTQVAPNATAPLASTAAPSTPVESSNDRASPYDCTMDVDAGAARKIGADVGIDFNTKRATVRQQLVFVNREDIALDSIIIDVQINQWNDSFALDAILVKGAPAYHELQLNRLEIPLAIALPKGCAIDIEMSFGLFPEAIRDGLRAYRGYFGYSPRQLNLAHFLPSVAARVDGEWLLHEPAGIGEQIVYDVVDWEVTIDVLDGGDSLQLAAPGAVTQLEPGKWQVALENSRDFSISLSDSYRVQEKQTASGVTVVVYSFADAQGAVNVNGADSATHALQETVKAVELFEHLFGDYPYRRFVVVQADFPDGMEFTGMVYVGSAWFTHFDGTPYNYLTLITVHETAHQWWYARVGNDTALNPWLDEALTTYSEYLFIESYYPKDKDWWWTFRVASFYPQGDVDSTVYEFSTPRQYINAIYLRGAQMMHNLREDVGDESFFSLLRRFFEQGNGGIADPKEFWGLLSPEEAALTAKTRDEFLRDPTVNAFFQAVSSDQN